MKAVNTTKWKEHLKRKWETADPNEVDICSYPPEDVEVERWGEALMKHANHLLQTAQTDARPFVADFGGGPDIRQTLRRFYEKRIYVKTEDQGRLEFGSIVVIFDDDEQFINYPFQMTWLGEHSQESDMAFYSTLPGAEIVGPGISRMEHGGFMMTYPPMRMFDIWIDPAFDFVPRGMSGSWWPELSIRKSRALCMWPVNGRRSDGRSSQRAWGKGSFTSHWGRSTPYTLSGCARSTCYRIRACAMSPVNI